MQRTESVRQSVCPRHVTHIDTTVEKSTKSLGVTWEPALKLL